MDTDILVVEKPAGMPVQTRGIADMDLVSELKNFLRKPDKGEPYLGIIHRLDRPVGGILVFALNKNAAAGLSRQIKDGDFNKRYRALVEGIINTDENETVLIDYLIKDKDNKALITDENDKEGKRAELKFKIINTDKEKNMTLLDIKLITGRFHQIRAQLSNIGHPIVNDVKYGAKKDMSVINPGGICLFAYLLSFKHPKTGEEKVFTFFDGWEHF